MYGKQAMSDSSKDIEKFLLKEIPRHQIDIVAFAARTLSVSRMTVHRHLNNLLSEGQIIRTGRQKGTKYFLKNARDKTLNFTINADLQEFDVWQQYFREQFSSLPENLLNICHYGFTEMLNNVIDHSGGNNVIINTQWKNNSIIIIISDDGVGIFQKLQNVFHFTDKREGILALSKGKLTTDPDNHTGEGIFFTSQAFDVFQISANGISYVRDNLEHDWVIDDGKVNKGTTVVLKIKQNSKRKLKEIFDTFTSGEDFAFDKTHVLVKLSHFKEEQLISRSQAKRILFGLEKFREVILDFQDIKTVGQGFVDEVFRIFKRRHPEINIICKNANQNITFMIERGINTDKMNM